MGGEHAELILLGIKKLLQLHRVATGELHSEETVREYHMILLEPCAHFAKSLAGIVEYIVRKVLNWGSFTENDTSMTFFEMSMPINDLFFIPLYRILQEGALYVRVSHIF